MIPHELPTIDLTAFAWPAARVAEAIESVARRGGLSVRAAEAMPAVAAIVNAGDERQLGDMIQSYAAWYGLEAEPVEAPYSDARRLAYASGPALLAVNRGSDRRLLALVSGDAATVTLITPSFDEVRVGAELVRAALCAEVESTVAPEVSRIVAAAGAVGPRAARTKQALFDQLLAGKRVGGCWLIRSHTAAGLLAQAREARLPALMVTMLAAHAVEYGLWIASWWLLGSMTLAGRLESGWLIAWLLTLVSLIPFRLLTTRSAGLLAVRAAALLRRRLLIGAFRLDADLVRSQGAGELLGRVLESDAVESMAISGGFLGVVSLIELVMAAFVLGASSGWLPLLLLASVAVGAGVGWRCYRRQQTWTAQRLDMTNDLVERMIGHRTRLAQEPREHWNDGEDLALEQYVHASSDMNRSLARLQALVPRGWPVAAIGVLAVGFVSGGRSAATLGVGVGGIVLAYRALVCLVDGMDRLCAAAIAWQRIKLFWDAAARRESVGLPGLSAKVARPASNPGDAAPVAAAHRPPLRTAGDAAPVTATHLPPLRTEGDATPVAAANRPPLRTEGDAATVAAAHRPPLRTARELAFRYDGRSQAVLDGVGVRIEPGDRLLLEGPSGGGKSTLAAILAGSRVPTSGLVLLGGLDRASIGADAWRRRVVIAPQFHDNHVLMGTFAFNALMGRGWPPRDKDLEDADRVCRALELGPLLDRMPAGLHQTVGETGWQLSHGERSRLFIARAILQGADLVILDESFGSLDPHTLQRTLEFVLQQAPTLLVIAHP